MVEISKRVPPARLILDNKIGTLDKSNVQVEFQDLGEKMAKGLIKMGGIKPTDHILDVGSGLGRVSLGFSDYLTTGSYTGLDIVKSSVDWCTEAYADKHQFRFVHADLYSKFYNPDSKISAENYKFPLDKNSFDFQFSMSLFTHLMFEAAENYLNEICSVLKPGKKTVNTFFLLDKISDELSKKTITHPVKGGRIRSIDQPEAFVAFHLDQIENLYDKAGLKITKVSMGKWSGRKDFAGGYQDTIFAEKVG
jgi:ubiquinone/menaquinone biosynthesis C-methylase UbiE